MEDTTISGSRGAEVDPEDVTPVQETEDMHANPNDIDTNYLGPLIQFMAGFKHDGDSRGNIDMDIEFYRGALALRVPPHPDRGISLNKLANAIHTRFKERGELEDLEEAIELWREALASSNPDDLNHPNYLNNLAVVVLSRFQQLGDLNDITEAIKLNREALGFHPPPHPNRGGSLNNLANVLHIRFEEKGETNDIDEAIELYRESLTLRAAPHPNRGGALSNLANAVQTRFEQRGDPQDIDEAIELSREALALCALPHPEHGTSLTTLANTVFLRFQLRGDPKDIDEAIKLSREVLALYAAPNLYHATCLSNLATLMQARFEQQGVPRDIDEVITLRRAVLALRALPHPNHGSCLNQLATALFSRFTQQGDQQDINEAIKHGRSALAFYASSHLGRSMVLNNLANVVQTRFDQQGDLKDLNEAIELHREALVLCAPPHPDRGTCLNNLGSAVQKRFEQQGDPKDIDESIELCRAALECCEPQHPNRGNILNNLETAIITRFKQRGDPKDIDETIKLCREALALHRPPHPKRGNSLINLARAVQIRFAQQGDPKDIHEAIKLSRESLDLHAAPHPNRSSSLNCLANALLIRFEQHKDQEDIDEAIELHREALSLHAPSQPNRGMSLNNLANVLQTKFEQQGEKKDLDEAIQLHREALALQASSHSDHGMSLYNLADALQTRFEQQKDPNDANEAIELHREVLGLRAPPHAQRGSTLTALGYCLVTFHTHTNDHHALNNDFALFQEASTYISSSPLTRFRHARSWAMTADRYNHPSSLSAYSAEIELLPQLAALYLDLPSRRQMLSTVNATKLASDAATCAVDRGLYNTAVEFLEASRSVFWSQALHLRTPLADLETIRPDLSRRLAELSKELERISFRDASRNMLPTTDQHKVLSMEAEGAQSRDLNKSWEETIASVRMVPGYEDFLQPKSIEKLHEAALQGPIVVIHCGKASSNALVLIGGQVEHVALPKLRLRAVQRFANILQEAVRSPVVNIERNMAHSEDKSLFGRLLGQREGSEVIGSDEIFGYILSFLWDSMVLPIFTVLGLKKSTSPARLWWCPTGPLAFLPIHASGIYEPDHTDCVSDYVVSSYTPTITALLNPPRHTTDSFKMTAVIEPDAPNCSHLPGARQELKKITERVPDQWLTTLGDKTPATVETALINLRASSIVHFACHGIQDLEQPLDGGLILTDGRLRVSDIMRMPENGSASDFDNMVLAFLSACETAKGDNTVPDEAMHLAATLLFAGFRGVVATMWTMDDRDGPKIADAFYEHLFKNCDPNSNPPALPDLAGAAKALHLAVVKLRDEPNIPFKRWVPFVHYGL